MSGVMAASVMSGCLVAPGSVVDAAVRRPMPHVVHRQHRPRIERRHRRPQPRPDGERPCSKSRAVHGLREDGAGLHASRLDDDVERLGDGHAQFVHGDRTHRKPVCRHHGHADARNPDVEVRHRRPVDDPQSHALARHEQPRPVLRRRLPVDQIRVRVAGHVGEVRCAHAHGAPLPALRQRRLPAVAADVAHEVDERPLAEVVVVRLLLQVAEDVLGRLVAPVSQHDDVLAIPGEGLRLPRLDDQRPIDAELLLEA